MEKRIELAKSGRRFWLSLVEQYHIDNSQFVVVLPGDERENNEQALYYLKAFIQKKGLNKIILLTSDKWVEEQQTSYCSYAQLVMCENENIRALLQFYSLYEFTTNIIVASLDEPAGRMGRGIVGKKGLDFGEIFAGVVYGLVDE